MPTLRAQLAVAVALVSIASPASAQQKTSDREYVAEALSAAPSAVAKGATVVRAEADGKMRTLRTGTNGFTCMVVGTDRMCNDANSMAFLDAYMKHAPPPDKIGISYMLAGDKGASNTDPYAAGKTATDHWVVTGPHLMIFGPPTRTLGYPTSPDPDPSKPYMMWVGTPYEHAMIPLGGGK